VPVTVAGHRHRVDGVDLPAGRAQAGDQQPARGLDRHRDRVFGASPCCASRSSSRASPAASSLTRRWASAWPSRSTTAMSWWSSAQSIPQNMSNVLPFLSFLSFCCAVRAGPGRAGHARSLMEGLEGTAIRLAVRDPSCPQAPVLAGARRLPAQVRGCSCGWLRTRPLSLRERQSRRMPPGVPSIFPVTPGWCRDPDLVVRDQVPRSTERVPGTSHGRHPGRRRWHDLSQGLAVRVEASAHHPAATGPGACPAIFFKGSSRPRGSQR
jgi:hypothetical protein